MVLRDQVMGLLVEACPSYRTRWDAYRASDEFEEDLLYLHLGDFADNVVTLLASAEPDLASLSNALERLHTEGDEFVREAATIGLLEGIQNLAGHGSVSTRAFEVALGPETRRWWVNLNAFWEGKIPHVGADIEKGSG